MPPENGYNLKDILDLQLSPIRDSLDGIKRAIEGGEVKNEKRFIRFEKELEELRKEIVMLQTDNARYKTIWGIGATLSATVFAFLLNRIF